MVHKARKTDVLSYRMRPHQGDWHSLEDHTDDEDDFECDGSASEMVMPSVGRGMKLPPICDVALPKAYYDELPAQVHTLSGMGRGQQMQEHVGGNSSLEAPGHRVFFPALASPEQSSLIIPLSLEDEFPELNTGNRRDMVISEEEPVSQPEQPETVSLKTIAAQFAAAK